MKRTFLAVGVFLSLVIPQAQSGPRPHADPMTEPSPTQRNLAQSLTRRTSEGLAPSTIQSPQILSYTPLFGPPGTVVTINGTGFGSLQGDSYVSVLSASNFHTYTKWPATNWSDTKIVVRVPNNMPLGKVYLIVEVAEQDIPGWYPFTVGVPPSITSYSPLYGGPGAELTIHGTDFGQSQDSSYVSALSQDRRSRVTWLPTSWSDTQIVVRVPSKAPLAKVYLYVTVNRLDTIGTYPFTVGVPPTIAGYSPLYGDPGTELTINGSGFGQSQASSSVSVLSSLTNSRITWTPTNWTDTQIVVPVPSDTPLGKVYLYVTVNGLDTIGAYPFTVGVPPTIAGYSPLYGDPGTELTIRGTGFGPRANSSAVLALSSVTNSWTSWNPTIWTDTQIVVQVPSNMPLGKVYLSVSENGLQSIGTYPFTVGVPPQITSYTPSLGPDGTLLIIKGTGFGATQGGSYVTLQSLSNQWTTLAPQSWSDTQVEVTVPNLTPAGSNYLSITVGGLQSIGTYPFQVTIAQ
jgi:IPT/TIG domain